MPPMVRVILLRENVSALMDMKESCAKTESVRIIALGMENARILESVFVILILLERIVAVKFAKMIVTVSKMK
jgi:hypothetical protein